MFVEDFIGRFEPEALSGPVIELIYDGVKAALGELFKASSLGQIAAYKAVGILICPTLVGGIRVGEIDIQRELLADEFVGGELGAIVEGDGLNPGCGPIEELLDDGAGDWASVLGMNFDCVEHT